MDNIDKIGKNKLFKEQHHQFSPKLWTQTYVTQDTSNKALFNFEVNNASRRARRTKCANSRWDLLPDILLEKIFGFLSIRQRYYASLVCTSWYRAFYMPHVWRQFVLGDSTLTRARFNYYEGWQYVLDHVRSQNCLTQVGCYFKKLTFEPMLNFFNLYEFMNMISWYMEQTDNKVLGVTGVGLKVRSLKFTFPCNMDNKDEVIVEKEGKEATLFGTGGRLLGALKRLMSNLKTLKRLELIDLMLELFEAENLLDEVCDVCCLTMETLILINTTRMQYQLLHVGVFLNLQVLIISPQNLGDDVIELLGQTRLRNLHIFQNRYTPDYVYNTVTPRAWKQCLLLNPSLVVHLELESIKDKRIICPEGAPVRSILYNSPVIGVQLHEVIKAVELYKGDLRFYGHKNMPRGYRPRSFYKRIDESVMLLCRQCMKLEVLVICERISTCTVLMIASTCKNLKKLHIRRNAVIKRFDWQYNPNWSNEYYQWLKMSSRSYDEVENEVSQILGYRWKMLSDKNFMNLDVNLYI